MEEEDEKRKQSAEKGEMRHISLPLLTLFPLPAAMAVFKTAPLGLING